MYYQENNILMLNDILRIFILIILGALNNKKISLPRVNTNAYGINSITYQSIKTWNIINKTLSRYELPSSKKRFCKNMITKFLISHY